MLYVASSSYANSNSKMPVDISSFKIKGGGKLNIIIISNRSDEDNEDIIDIYFSIIFFCFI